MTDVASFMLVSPSNGILRLVRKYMTGRLRAAGAMATIGLATACTSLSNASPSAGGTPAASPARAATSAKPTVSAIPTPRPHVTIARVRAADGSLVTLALFSGPVQYVLHNGSQDPGPAASGLVKAGPAVTGPERQRLLAVFNGGFKLNTGAGGYAQEGHVISSLRSGLASLVIDRSGRARIGVWGDHLPEPGEAVYSVRQNLSPLVRNGRPTPAAADWRLWGATLGGGEYVARSAVGEDAAGDLIYAASMSTSPADLAYALARSGVRTAMELDINPEWVQLDTARSPGGQLTAAVHGQYRPATQYLLGWTRDFITVLAPAAG
jgi:hypothetical protein